MIERERIRVRCDAGLPGPHTEDPRLRDYWFPKFRRSDGRLHKWWADNINEDLPEPLRLYATLACWLFSKIETLELIKPILQTHGWDSHMVLTVLGGWSNVTSADTPHGILPRNLGDVCAIMESAEARAIEYQPAGDLAERARSLSTVRGIGEQLGYEVACALHPHGDWIYPGKTTVRATGLLLGLDLNPDSQYGRAAARDTIGELHREAGGAFGWTLPDAQKALELFNNYARPERPKRRYRWS